ncbi:MULTISPECIES: lysis protein [unclassified Tatumella]|uniref:lysis protein n=1 Tax=unclassified Tatumella TaxID=2649542 RepID=UPI001BB0AF02|nr:MULTISPECIES: lysis protein [unclassified Tatumella]MBS0878406.1 lysis protein [Tatumella sp. JGM82]MBS0891202.1 lysis protein [Tatumella sp. JGM94]MBS0902759.1 lysis protein [Tatumella sp. JGM100]
MIWLLANWRYVLITLLAGILLSVVSLMNHYRHSANEWKATSQQQSSLADSRLKTINTMQAQQKAVSDIDNQYQKTIKAKDDEISSLRNSVDSGAVRLRVKALCPAGVFKTGTASGSVNAASAELDPDARQNYYTLRSQLNQATAQINGLQAYIREITK